MQVANTKLKDYFHSELSALRNEAVLFGKQHPELARSLGLNARSASDPQVELLLQSFAFLTGRLRYQIEQDKADGPNSLLAFLYPHLEAPIPSMLIAQIEVKPENPVFAKEQMLERGRYISASALNDQGQKTECRFRTCYNTPLLPLAINDIKWESNTLYPQAKSHHNVQSLLRIRLSSNGVELQSKGRGPERLRFYINQAEPNALALYELLALNLVGLSVQIPGQDANEKLLSCNALTWLGMEDNEAMLPGNPQTHPGYRLLQEYFSFPEKFLFFDIHGLTALSFAGADQSFDLLLLLDVPVEANQAFAKSVLLLNCVPLVNLFSQRIDPIALNQTEYEYHMLGDLKNHRYCEIYAIESLESIRPNGSPRPIAPYFSMDDFQRMEQQDYFYVTRREPSDAENLPGSEIYVSFLDEQFDLTHPVDEVVGGRALCTNRALPEQIVSGTPMYLEGSGPVQAITALTRPTAHQTPARIGSRPWSLVSQLSLNHLSLANRPEAIAALKDILRLHVGANPSAGHKQIDAIDTLRSRSILRHMLQDGWRGFVRGHEITLVMDQTQFNEASAVLFCSVLRHFFRLYASVNNIVELNLETHDIKGVQKQWQPLAGAKMVL